MSQIRGKNTKIELLIFKELRKRGIYFQKHYKRIIGNPDIALPRKKKAVFIDGDFWHGYQFEKLKKRLPQSYWIPKILNNINRDKRINRGLKKLGWNVVRIWENKIIKDLDGSVDKIEKFLKE